MITNYKQAKEDVLKLYSEFMKICEDADYDSAGTDTSMKALKKQAENIRQDRFLLMIAGEAKSGKSTFINAYLGEDILPMDIKQCTSSIVEICYGESLTLTATYADGRTRKLTDGEDDIKRFLTDNAALNDDYRDIPIPTINNEILIKCKGNVNDQHIRNLIVGVQDENIHNLAADEYEAKIRRYIESNKDNWQEIVTKMRITYPIKDEDLKGVEIIDSPGVNADGRIGDITESYIENADAVMFLKPMSGQALESSSFKKFMKSKSMDRNKNALFVVLTRAANETADNRERIYQEALNQFKGVEKEHIVLVDSKVEMFIKNIQDKSTEEIQQTLDELGRKQQLDPFILLPWFTSEKNKKNYIQSLKEISNFMEIENVLNRFGRKSHYIALSEFLERMIKIYTKLHDNFSYNIKLYETKAKDPIEFDGQILKATSQLDGIKEKMNYTVHQIQGNYTRGKGIVVRTVNERIESLKEDIASIQGEDMEELRRVSFKKIDELTIFQKELQKNFVAECNEALVALSDESTVPYTSLEPDFTMDMFKSIVDETESSAQKTEYYETGITFKKTESTSRYSRSKHFDIVRESISERLDKIKNDAINDLYDFVINTAGIYIDELVKNAKLKQAELEQIKSDKKEAEELQETIARLKSLVERIEPQNRMLSEIKGGIDSYV